MAIAVAGVVVVEVVVLAVWTAVAPLQWVRVVTQVDANGFPTSSYGACLGTTATAGFAGAVFGMHGLSAGLSAVFAWSIRNVPSDFHDGSVGIALIVVAQIYLVAVPVVVAVYSSVVGRFVVASTAIFVGDAVLLGFIFYPKLKALRDAEGSTGSKFVAPAGDVPVRPVSVARSGSPQPPSLVAPKGATVPSNDTSVPSASREASAVTGGVIS